MKNWTKLKQELLQNPAVKQEYQKLEPEYKLARDLLKARLQKNLTQAQLAKKAGVKQEYVARLEGASGNPTIASVNKIARVLGKEVKLVGAK